VDRLVLNLCTVILVSLYIPSTYSFTSILAVKSILLGSDYGVHGDVLATPDVMLRARIQCRFFHPHSFSILLTEFYGLWEIWVLTLTPYYHLPVVWNLY
jgi:hypothetical protein